MERAQSKPQVIAKQGEESLRAVYFYRYMTALDVAQLLYSPSSLKYVRSRLSALAGNADFKTNEYLYRFKLPSGGGNTKRIYTLGSRGRDFLANEVGLPVSWYYRPEKVRHMSYGQMMHIDQVFLLARVMYKAVLGLHFNGSNRRQPANSLSSNPFVNRLRPRINRRPTP